MVCSRILASLAFCALAGLSGAGLAQPFPSKTVRIVVPFPPGGTADLTSRILAEQMARGLGQNLIVENRPGGGTAIGTDFVARAPADGHTLLVVFPSFVINPAIRRGATFDPLKDFAAVGQAASVPMVIAVHPSVSATSLKDLAAMARAKPGEVSYGSSGPGGLHHLIGELFRLTASIELNHVPFQGGAPATSAAVGGHVRMLVSNTNEVAPYAKSGKLRALAITSPSRTDALPEVLTVREAGFPELEATNWSGFVVPGATPPTVISRLNAELVRAVNSAEAREKFRAQGLAPSPGTPEQFAELLKSESARWGRIARQANVKVD
jgi:tripartite-type tricarboxylate transporter receptor subunit TctC